MLNDVARVADMLLLTRPESERAAHPQDLYDQLQDVEGKEVRLFVTVDNALKMVQEQASVDDLVVVAGSLYLIGEFRKLLVGEVVG